LYLSFYRSNCHSIRSFASSSKPRHCASSFSAPVVDAIEALISLLRDMVASIAMSVGSGRDLIGGRLLRRSRRWEELLVLTSECLLPTVILLTFYLMRPWEFPPGVAAIQHQPRVATPGRLFTRSLLRASSEEYVVYYGL